MSNPYGKLSEYELRHWVAHRIAIQRWDKAGKLLTDLSFVEAKCSAGMTYGLVADYDAARGATDNIRLFGQFVALHANIFARDASLIVPFGHNYAREGPVVALWASQKSGTKKLFDLYTSFSGDYSDDLIGFAKAGGIDIRLWVPLISFWLVFVLFLSTYASPLGDPIWLVRSPWSFVLALAIGNHLLNLGLARHLFGARFGPAGQSAGPAVRATAEPSLRHGAPVYVCRFSIDGKHVASGTDDGTVWLWDAATGQQLVMRGHAGPVVCLAFAPDGLRLASAGLDTVVRTWSTQTGEPAGNLATPAPLHDLTFSVDGMTMAGAGDDGRVYVWQNGTPRAIGIAGRAVRWLAISADGRALAALHRDRMLHFWNLVSAKREWSLPDIQGPIALSPDGQVLAVGKAAEPYHGDAAVRLLDVRTGSQRALFPTDEGQLCAIAFSPKSMFLVAGTTDRTLWVWDLFTSELVERQPLKDNVEDFWFDPVRPVVHAVNRNAPGRPPEVYRVNLGYHSYHGWSDSP